MWHKWDWFGIKSSHLDTSDITNALTCKKFKVYIAPRVLLNCFEKIVDNLRYAKVTWFNVKSISSATHRLQMIKIGRHNDEGSWFNIWETWEPNSLNWKLRDQNRIISITWRPKIQLSYKFIIKWFFSFHERNVSNTIFPIHSLLLVEIHVNPITLGFSPIK